MKIDSLPRAETAVLPADAGSSLPAKWNALLAPYRRSSATRSVLQLVSTAALFVVIWWAMLRSLEISYWITLLLSIVEAGVVVRLFIFLHDCAHGSFFKWTTANQLVGRVLGVLTLTPFCYWRRTHMIHHATAGNLDRRGFGDVDTWTVREYLGKPRFSRICYRLFRNPLVMLVLGPVLLFVVKHRLPLDMPFSWKKEWSSILWNNVALAGVLLVMSSTVGLLPFLAVQIPVFLISAAAGIWLFYVQHQYERTYWQREERWDFVSACLQGSSYLDLKQPLRWFTGDIGVHHVHHLCSAIPNYRLKECMDRVKELPAPRRLTFWQSLRCGRLSLWDEDSERLIGFRDLRRLKFRRAPKQAQPNEEQLARVG